MADRTETLVRGHQAWVADVSHQLRTPLAALRLRLDLLTGEVDDTAAAELAGAQGEIARLSRLLDGLLAVARAESAVPHPEPVRADDVASERVTAWEPVARERDISLSARLAGPVLAYLSPGDLEQMLDNIVANALDAVPDGGTVRIEATRRNGRATVCVVDNGPGMDKAAKDAAVHRRSSPATGRRRARRPWRSGRSAGSPAHGRRAWCPGRRARGLRRSG